MAMGSSLLIFSASDIAKCNEMIGVHNIRRSSPTTFPFAIRKPALKRAETDHDCGHCLIKKGWYIFQEEMGLTELMSFSLKRHWVGC